MSKGHIGISCLPGRGHLYPSTALGRQLQALGYRVTVFSRLISKAIVKAAGLDFQPIEGEQIPSFTKEKNSGNGPNTAQLIHSHTLSTLRQAPEVLRATGVDALLVDQMDFASGTVADFLNIPFVTIVFNVPLYLNDEVPPCIYDWRPSGCSSDTARNRRGNSLLRRLYHSTLNEINNYRKTWKLPLLNDFNEIFSRRAIVTQLPAMLDFPRKFHPSHLFHTGPFNDGVALRPVDFPWQRLGSKPLVYACLGTVRNNLPSAFQIITRACADFDVQLVLSLGGMQLTPDKIGPVPEGAIIVHYAPQNEILRHASLNITHAGVNSTLEAVANGVPMVAIPITDDQPGMAARIEWQGLGQALPFQSLSVPRLQGCIQTVLSDSRYRSAARNFQTQLREKDGLGNAINIIDKIFS